MLIILQDAGGIKIVKSHCIEYVQGFNEITPRLNTCIYGFLFRVYVIALEAEECSKMTIRKG